MWFGAALASDRERLAASPSPPGGVAFGKVMDKNSKIKDMLWLPIYGLNAWSYHANQGREEKPEQAMTKNEARESVTRQQQIPEDDH